MNDVPLPAVSRLLGHSNVLMTPRYAHLGEREIEDLRGGIGIRHSRSAHARCAWRRRQEHRAPERSQHAERVSILPNSAFYKRSACRQMHDLPSRGDACGRRRPARFDGGAERWRRRSPGPRVRRRPRRVTAVDAMRCLRRHERRAVFPQAVDPTGAVALAGDPGRAPDAAYRRADAAPRELATFQRLAALAPSVGSGRARAVTWPRDDRAGRYASV